ncbi:MAG: hypothetical protein M3Y54_07205 [Bacteroidota bacterium]|nr:hypothetical protein [Bacteroidota bacterium]
MSTEKLAFLQNFYTDVTLYVPAELASVAAPPPPASAVAASEVALAPPTAPVASAPKPAVPTALAQAPVPPRPSSMPSTGFVKPSAGLERLTSKMLSPPVAASAPAPEPLASPAAAPVAPAGVNPALLTPFTVAGSRREGVVLLCRLPHENFVKLHRNVFLNKMLQALELVMEDVLLVNVESELPVALVNLRQQVAATHIIAFGKNLLDVTIRNTQIYEPVQFPSLGLSYLASATIDLVEYDVSLKKRLWPGLQRMFLR